MFGLRKFNRRMREFWSLIKPPTGFESEVNVYCSQCYEDADKCLICKKPICIEHSEVSLVEGEWLCKSCAGDI